MQLNGRTNKLFIYFLETKNVLVSRANEVFIKLMKHFKAKSEFKQNRFVHLGTFDVPIELRRLIEKGEWPQAGSNRYDQETNPIVGVEITQRIWPDYEKVILISPPFHTIGDEVEHGNTFWTEFLTNVGEIDYSKALIIADFGAGTDSPIILYYDNDEPSILYLKWLRGGQFPLKHSWICTHKSFNEFARDIGLI